MMHSKRERNSRSIHLGASLPKKALLTVFTIFSRLFGALGGPGVNLQADGLHLIGKFPLLSFSLLSAPVVHHQGGFGGNWCGKSITDH